MCGRSQERAQLAKALTGAKVTLHSGLQTSASQGKPISAKFEGEDGKLQLSIYTVKGDGFSEVVINPANGKVDKAETITDKRTSSTLQRRRRPWIRPRSR